MTDINRQELEAEEAIGHSIDTLLYLVRTSVPGVVTEVDLARNCVSVQPAIMGKLSGRAANPLPIVLDVPIAYYGAGGFVVTHKPAIGDVCLLVASDRSLSRWKQAGGVVDPAERRRHNLTDSVAYFGLNHFGGAYPAIKNGIDIRTRDGSTSLNLTSGSVTFTAGGTPVFTATSSSVAFSVPITAPEATINGIKQTTHRHSGVQSGSSNTGGPL